MTASTPVTFRQTPRDRSGTKVALIRPNVVVFPKSLSWYGPVPPLGIAYVAAVLREGGHSVQVVDSPGEAIGQHTDFETSVGTLRSIGLRPDEVVARLDADVTVVGITNMFLHEWPQVREIAELARARFPDAVVVVGGENATAFGDWMLAQCDAIDAVVLGEGEATALELADRVADGEGIVGMAGVAARDVVDGSIHDSGLPTRLRQLDRVPLPAWDLVPLENYWDHADYFGVERGRSLPAMATRGCPYRCSFCSSPQMWTTRYVVRDPEDVAAEIAGYVERYGVQNINFCDLTAITKRKWTLAFCDALEREAPGITWQLPVGTRAEALDAEVLQRLWDTGCRNLTYAPESGSRRMLEVYDKRVDLEPILESLAVAHRLGIVTRINLILGHPEERWSDIWLTAKFLMRAMLAGTNDAAVMMFAPYPGSADFDALRASGRLAIDEDLIYTGLSRASSAHRSFNERLSSRQLRAVQMTMLLVFYGTSIIRRPSRAVGHLRSWFTGRERTAVDQLLRVKREGRRQRRHPAPATRAPATPAAAAPAPTVAPPADLERIS